MFREQVRRIDSTINFSEVNPLAPHRLLYPQQVCVEVPELPKTLAAADANRRGGVGPDSELQPVPQVGHQALEAETHPSAADGPVELGFS